MTFELQAMTDSGRNMVSLAEAHAEDFVLRAGQHDQDRTVAFENFEAIKTSGLSGCAAPVELGGAGMSSMHDWMVCMNRLGRGDGSTALAFNMHMNRTLGLTRAWQASRVTGNEAREIRSAELLKRITSGDLIIAVANAEPGADIRTSSTEAKKTAGGWILNGRKTFATGSPAAGALSIRFKYTNDSGEDRMGAAIVPTDRDGMDIKGNWDGMGMRGSGSHDVVLADYFVKDEELDDIGEYGRFNAPMLSVASGSNLGLAAIFLGIAEFAHRIIVDSIKNKGHARHPMSQFRVAENEVDLATCIAMLDYSGRNVDEFYREFSAAAPTNDIALLQLKDTQSTKLVVNKKAVDVVDRCMALSGGAGYLESNVISRLYRDVRAGPLMQPFAANKAYEFIGLVALGLDPSEEMIF